MESWDKTRKKIDAEFLWWDWWFHFGQYLTNATYRKSFLKFTPYEKENSISRN